MPTVQYNLLDDDGTLFLVNYIFTKLKNSPLNKNTTYSLSKDDTNKKYVLTGSDGTSTQVDFFEYSKATAAADGLMSKEDFVKLSGIETGAQVNIIEKIKVNNTAMTVDTTDKSVNITTLTTSDVNDLITAAIAGITGMKFIKVNSYSDLPATGESNAIYLVPNSGTSPDIYTEYIYYDSKYEKIGSTAIDLSGYVKHSDIALITNAEITTIVDDAYTDVFDTP